MPVVGFSASKPSASRLVHNLLCTSFCIITPIVWLPANVVYLAEMTDWSGKLSLAWQGSSSSSELRRLGVVSRAMSAVQVC